jgi:hypothetical protein
VRHRALSGSRADERQKPSKDHNKDARCARVAGADRDSRRWTWTESATCVSWLPGRILDRKQATIVTAIANIVGDRGLGLPDDLVWPHLDAWAAELGLSGPEAATRSRGPGERSTPGARPG